MGIFMVLFLFVYIVIGILVLSSAEHLYKSIVSYLERNEVRYGYFLKLLSALCITCIAVALAFYSSQYIYNYIVHAIYPSGGF